MSRPTVIALTGYAGHGKDTIADSLVEHLGFVKLAFGDHLRTMALAINPIVYLSTDCQTILYLKDIVDKIGWDRAKREYPEVRRFLQRLGTEGVRECVSPDFWVDYIAEKIRVGFELEYATKFVLSDVRYPNEYRYTTDMNAFKIRVHDPRKPIPEGHSSESFVEQMKVNETLINDGTIKDLQDKAVSLVQAEVFHVV